jgi:phosphatidylserine decarboxylase
MLAEARDRGNKVVYMVVYLSPGDYHRFHSPANFTANFRRHITGYLYSVNPSYLDIYKDVLKQNERVNLLGDWGHGFFGISFVGATNVGSIVLNFDESVVTNHKRTRTAYTNDKDYTQKSEQEEYEEN